MDMPGRRVILTAFDSTPRTHSHVLNHPQCEALDNRDGGQDVCAPDATYSAQDQTLCSPLSPLPYITSFLYPFSDVFQSLPLFSYINITN
jgi:hypothetical protein